MSAYVELQCTSHFSFLRGASSCEELFAQAAANGMSALAITDRNSLLGIVRAFKAAQETGVRLIVGCHLNLIDGSRLLVYPTKRAAYARLCRLLTLGKGRGGKAACHLSWADVAEYSEGLIGILVPDQADETCKFQLKKVNEIFGKDGFLALTLQRRPGDALRLHHLSKLAAKAGIKTVVTNDVLYHTHERRMLQDVMTCIRHRCTIDNLGFKRERNADRQLLSPDEMARRFSQYPEALARTVAIAKRCRFSLAELTYQYPKEILISGKTSQESLEELTWKGADWRYPQGVPLKVQAALHHELRLIEQLEYAPYFLTVHSIVRFAQSQDILYQGRGSAANSAVCFVLGITSIDPDRSDLLFERFISQERREPPDIDVDFEHARREVIMQWILNTYGRHRAALCSTVVRYGAKAAARDVGKALGLPMDVITGLSSQVWGWSKEGVQAKHVQDLNLNLNDRRLNLMMELARELIETPRHLSQHTGGFVLTDDRLDELVPIEPASMKDRQVIEWDKDDIDIMKFMKVDCLALGMMTTLKLSFDMLEDCKGIKHDLASIPAEDPETYKMISKGDTIGVFQIESRAQINMLPRMKPKTFYDLVIEVAIVRPGPIQGNMVHPYIRRREGLEPVDYPSPQMKEVLGKTLGIPLFQEQAMRVAIECAGFTPSEADQLRRAMATFKFTGGVTTFRDKLVNGMIERGYTKEYAQRTFAQLEGFGSYGFPESHAASFALLSYASSWLKCHHPEVFCASLLNSQPMGFYAIAQLVRDVREHSIEVRPVCINTSRWLSTLEYNEQSQQWAVRLGMRVVNGLSEEHGAVIIAARGDDPYTEVEDVWRRAKVPARAIQSLVEADAFSPSLHIARRDALWAAKALRDEQLTLFAAADARAGLSRPEIIEEDVTLKQMTAGREVVEDYKHVGLSLRAHPVSFVRPSLAEQGFISCFDANHKRDGANCKAAGIVLVRQRPGSAKGVMFITIEDEVATCNIVVWSSMFDKYRRTILGSGMLGVQAKVQREGTVVHLVATHFYDLSNELASVGDIDARIPLGRGDEAKMGGGHYRPPGMTKKPRDIYIPDLHIDTIKVKTRDFR